MVSRQNGRRTENLRPLRQNFLAWVDYGRSLAPSGPIGGIDSPNAEWTHGRGAGHSGNPTSPGSEVYCFASVEVEALASFTSLPLRGRIRK